MRSHSTRKSRASGGIDLDGTTDEVRAFLPSPVPFFPSQKPPPSQLPELPSDELPPELPSGTASTSNHSSAPSTTEPSQPESGTATPAASSAAAASSSAAGASGETQHHLDDEMPDWPKYDKHVFILSNAGKPIYSRHGNEDKLATIMGVMQALISFVEEDNDQLRCGKEGGTVFVA